MAREGRITNCVVLDIAARHNEVWGEESSKGKDYPFSVSTVTSKGDKQARDDMVSEVDRKWPKVL